MGWFATLIFFRGDITSVTGRLVGSLLGFLLTWRWMYLTAPAVLAVVKCVECLIDLGRNWAGAGERMGKQQIRWRVEITYTIPWSGLVTSSACWMNTLFKQLLARGSSVLKENIFCPNCSNALEELSWCEHCRSRVQHVPPDGLWATGQTSKGWLKPAERPRSHEKDVNLLKRGDPGPPKYITKILPEWGRLSFWWFLKSGCVRLCFSFDQKARMLAELMFVLPCRITEDLSSHRRLGGISNVKIGGMLQIKFLHLSDY